MITGSLSVIIILPFAIRITLVLSLCLSAHIFSRAKQQRKQESELVIQFMSITMCYRLGALFMTIMFTRQDCFALEPTTRPTEPGLTFLGRHKNNIYFFWWIPREREKEKRNKAKKTRRKLYFVSTQLNFEISLRQTQPGRATETTRLDRAIAYFEMTTLLLSGQSCVMGIVNKFKLTSLFFRLILSHHFSLRRKV